jgi:hypothetical protein
VVAKQWEAPAEEPPGGNINKEAVFGFRFFIEHDPLPRAEEEEVSVCAMSTWVCHRSAPTTADCTHVHVVVDVIGSQQAGSHVADEVEWKRRPVYHDRFHGAAVITVAVPFCTRRRLQVPTASNTHQGAGTLITEFL